MEFWRHATWYVLYDTVLEKLFLVVQFLGNLILLMTYPLIVLENSVLLFIFESILFLLFIKVCPIVKSRFLFMKNIGICSLLSNGKMSRLYESYRYDVDTYEKFCMLHYSLVKIWNVFEILPKRMKKEIVLTWGFKKTIYELLKTYHLDSEVLLWSSFCPLKTFCRTIEELSFQNFIKLFEASKEEITVRFIKILKLFRYDPLSDPNYRAMYDLDSGVDMQYLDENESTSPRKWIDDDAYFVAQETYTINEYLKVKLINGKTYIFVNDEEFMQCHRLLIHIPLDNVRKYDQIKSIDDLIGVEEHTYNIPPEVEFWGHCSNLQTWSEYGYDTRLLHSNLSFPLLKKLYEAGDPQAKKVFKEEVAQRFTSGNSSVMNYLLNQRYLEVLSAEEILSLVLDSTGKIKQSIKNHFKLSVWAIEIELFFRNIYESGNEEMKAQISEALSEFNREKDLWEIKCAGCDNKIKIESVLQRYGHLNYYEILEKTTTRPQLCNECIKKKHQLLKYCGYQSPREKGILNNEENEYIINDYLSVQIYTDDRWAIITSEISNIDENDLLWNIMVGGKKVNKAHYTFNEIEASVILASQECASADWYCLTHPKSFRKPDYEIVCENLWLWNYFNYNTRLLHSNTSFPLLKELYEAGDPKARRVFKKEIIRNLKGRPPRAFAFLCEHNFFKYIDKKTLIRLEKRKIWGKYITRAKKIKLFLSNYLRARKNDNLFAKMLELSVNPLELELRFAEYVGLEHSSYSTMTFEMIYNFALDSVIDKIMKLSVKNILKILFKLLPAIREKKENEVEDEVGIKE